MKRSNDRYYDDELNNFIHDAKTLFGFDEESLLAELEEAEREWEQEQREHPEEAAKIMQESDAKFEELMRKIEADGVCPAGVTAAAWDDLDPESDADWDSFEEDEFYKFEDEGEEDEEYDEDEAESITAVEESVEMMEEELAAEETAEEAATAEAVVADAVAPEMTMAEAVAMPEAVLMPDTAVEEAVAAESPAAEGTMPETMASEALDVGMSQSDDAKAIVDMVETVQEESEVADDTEINASSAPDVEAVAPLKKDNAKTVPFRKRKKVLLLVAAVAVMGIGTTLVAHGNREYKLRQYPLPGKRNIVVSRNSVLKTSQKGKLQEAYEQIEAELGIDVLVLNDVPREMKFKQLIINEDKAIIEFQYYDKSVYLKEIKISNDSEVSYVVVSDRKEAETVYNFWLDSDIGIEENQLENGLVEYSAHVQLENNIYYLSGIMDKSVFITLVESLSRK